MKWTVVVGGAALVVARRACHRRLPACPTTSSCRTEHGRQAPLPRGGGTAVQGTITNTGVTAADYSVQLVSSSGETTSGAAINVLIGQTAVGGSPWKGTSLSPRSG